MGRLADIAKGTRAIRRVELPLVNNRCTLLPDLEELADQRAADRAAWEESRQGSEPTTTVTVGLRVLLGAEAAEVLSHAAAFARSKGVTEPRDGDPLYELGKMVHTLLLAAVDPDSDPRAVTPFFASAEEILTSEHLGRDGIIYLFEQQEIWQEHCSPQLARFAPDELMGLIAKLSEDRDGSFFAKLRPAMRLILSRTSASLWLSSLMDKSLSGLISEADTSSAATEPSKPTGSDAEAP